jgi:hypothetical protein
MHPAPNGVLLSIQPLGNLGTALAIDQQQHAVVPLTQPGIVRAAKGAPDFIACDRSMSNRQYPSGPPTPSIRSFIPQGLKNRDYFVGSL